MPNLGIPWLFTLPWNLTNFPLPSHSYSFPFFFFQFFSLFRQSTSIAIPSLPFFIDCFSLLPPSLRTNPEPHFHDSWTGTSESSWDHLARPVLFLLFLHCLLVTNPQKMFLRSLWGSSNRTKSAVLAVSSWALSLLFLLSSNLVAAKSAADYYVRSLPGAPDGPLLKMHAGWVPCCWILTLP